MGHNNINLANVLGDPGEYMIEHKNHLGNPHCTGVLYMCAADHKPESPHFIPVNLKREALIKAAGLFCLSCGESVTIIADQ